MNLAPDELQTEIGDTARSFLADRLSMETVRALAKGDVAIGDADWQAIADMGWLAMLVPEAEGGLGLGLAEAVMVFRELGRHLTPGPVRSTVMAALLAANAGQTELAAALGDGTRRAGLLVGDLGLDAGVGGLVLSVARDESALYEVTTAEPVAGLDTGADDYLVKPFDPDELAARIRALHRRQAGRVSPTIEYGPLLLNPATREVSCHGVRVSLTAREVAA